MKNNEIHARKILSENESGTYKLLFWLTLLLGLAVFFWGLGDIALMSFNEARRALPAKEMFNSGDWLLPHLNGELYITKPPLIYWISTSFAHLIGSANEWAVRLPSAFAAITTIGMVYHYSLKQFGRWPALFTAQILIANAGFAMFARRAEIEMLLTALCVGSVLAAVRYLQDGAGRGWIYLSYFLLALAMLTKGPLVLLLVTLPILVMAICQKEPRYWHILGSLPGWGIFLVVGLSWYAAVTWRLGPDVWFSIVQRDIAGKIQGEAAKPFLSYLGWILIDFMPAALLLFFRPKSFVQLCKRQKEYILLAAAIIVPLLVFSFFTNKHAKYLLPIYPLIAIFLGGKLGEIFQTVNIRYRRLIMVLGVLLPVFYAGYYALAEAKLYNYRVSVFPALSAWSRTLPQDTLYGYKDIDERLLYYSEKPVRVLDEPAFRRLRESGQPILLLVESGHLAEIKSGSDCLVKEFKPYLKKNRVLTVLGFGSVCQMAAYH